MQSTYDFSLKKDEFQDPAYLAKWRGDGVFYRLDYEKLGMCYPGGYVMRYKVFIDYFGLDGVEH